MRNTSGLDLELPEMYSKLFTMSRIYNMKYDLTRSGFFLKNYFLFSFVRDLYYKFINS